MMSMMDSKYLTYKEWKPNTSAVNNMETNSVSTLPIRNGNFPQGTKRRVPFLVL